MNERLRIKLSAASGRPTITGPLIEHITTSVTQARARYITIEGEEGAFCEGFDLDLLSDSTEDQTDSLRDYAAMLRALERAACPIVALVDGVVLGGGLGIVGAGDLVIATPRSTFGFPEVLIGLIPAVALPFLARRVGVAKARLLALDGVAIDAPTALRIGLVDEITDDLDTAVARHARRWLRTDARAQQEVKAEIAEMNAPDAEAEALRRFAKLLTTAETQRRIVRMAAGEPPWLDDSEGEL
ncbi:enoyl-CoA hydratase/isomerase family protein [Kibdelosporangium philippinense]|uniref:Enoyl-CoA hydratase/isomerase family protein n=1 Tax=Kibdelosporangium philippinense TaxID=211113 RepID=A0ABS8Z412_9PSEU|nr:enoyl-CoA hydratase/isomerase family protein [Kibdelosporangium philippinense]MCE7002122.1 enoyl-CoA hydratase/isomerase family protein [Kibdelosporangium philippinense]